MNAKANWLTSLDYAFSLRTHKTIFPEISVDCEFTGYSRPLFRNPARVTTKLATGKLPPQADRNFRAPGI